MSVAQSLYESGKITYYENGFAKSFGISLKLHTIYIHKEFGKEFSNRKQYSSKTRMHKKLTKPSDQRILKNTNEGSTRDEERLYDLIGKVCLWQMSNARLKKKPRKLISPTKKKIYSRRRSIKI